MRQLAVACSFALLIGCGGRDAAPDPGSSRGADAAVPQLDAGKVPDDLRDLLPLAQRWGIGDDVDRAAKVEKATDAERAELKAAFGPRQDRITAWLDTFKPGTMTDEAAAFMYAQLAIEEMP